MKNLKNLKTGTLIAIAAGGLFASACKKDEKTTAAPAKEEATAPKKDEAPTPTQPAVAPTGTEKVSKVDCSGVNACKGQGTCKQEGHGCGGQNECKGKGVMAMTEEECKGKGGTVTAQK